ncbi:MAG TPA: hypothetical protein VFG70_03780 [Gaiellaceae bacterium]|nr:hypothetical protein [Gaiellaceae bacterium]
MDWREIDPEPLFDAIRARGPAPDAEQAVWAFEQALCCARIDGRLVEHLLVACVCLRAFDEDVSPRTILEQTFRRSVTDGEWHERFAPLLV